jgi:endonuclease/exonuclease/phosphatase family metal-dependent hydrolase
MNFLDPEGPRYYDTSRSAKAGSAEPGAARTLKVVTFNVEYGREIEAAMQLLRTSEALRDPDIVFLQELSSAGVVQLAGGMGLNYLYFPSGVHPQTRQEFGTAILSPWPIEKPAKLLLPHGAAITGLRRAVTAATIWWGDVAIRAYSVHLPSPMAISVDERREQIEVILDAARSGPGPAVVAGDFNSGSAVQWFERRGFTWLTRGLPGTSRGPGMWLPYDHVFAKGFEAVRGTWTAGTVEAGGVSDHRAVWARLAAALQPRSARRLGAFAPSHAG